MSEQTLKMTLKLKMKDNLYFCFLVLKVMHLHSVKPQWS